MFKTDLKTVFKELEDESKQETVMFSFRVGIDDLKSFKSLCKDKGHPVGTVLAKIVQQIVRNSQ